MEVDSGWENNDASLRDTIAGMFSRPTPEARPAATKRTTPAARKGRLERKASHLVDVADRMAVTFAGPQAGLAPVLKETLIEGLSDSVGESKLAGEILKMLAPLVVLGILVLWAIQIIKEMQRQQATARPPAPSSPPPVAPLPSSPPPVAPLPSSPAAPIVPASDVDPGFGNEVFLALNQ